MRSLVLAVIVSFVALVQIPGYSQTRPAAAFDTWWHAWATLQAMQTTGFSSDARLTVQVENYLTDFFSVVDLEHVNKLVPGYKTGMPQGLKGIDLKDMARLHFDDIFTTAGVSAQWTNLLANTRVALHKYATDPSVKSGFRLIVLFTILGASLHTVQDFYSHSNWVNLWAAQQPGKPVPTWYSVSPPVRNGMKLFTGAYPNGCCPGHVDHEVLSKDNSSKPLNPPAVDAAARASTEWVKMLMTDKTIPWAALQSYKVDPVVGKHFLYDLDATFLTSTSILAGHWDGAHPVKHVFDNDPAKEKAKAIQAALLVFRGYSTNLALKGNIYGLPTPYWAGFYMYHIERDLAQKLLPVNSPDSSSP